MKICRVLFTGSLIAVLLVITACVAPKDVKLHTPDLQKVADGKYEGSYQVFPVDVTARVTVKAHRIVSVELLKHFNGQGNAAEAITNRIIEAQTPEIDVISGATYSSKTILKAVETALDKAILSVK